MSDDLFENTPTSSGDYDASSIEVLEGLDTSDLTGKQMTVTGAFKLINPKMWLITPVEVSVQ